LGTARPGLAHAAGGVLGGPAVLRRRLARLHPPHGRHEHADRRGHRRRFHLFSRRDVAARRVRPGGPAGRRVLRGRQRHHCVARRRRSASSRDCDPRSRT
jgi:hypothetical protein